MTDLNSAVHNAPAQRFEIAVGEHTAFAHYSTRGSTTLDFDHTFVPPDLRGRGLAGALIATGLQHARAHGLNVVPSCSYVDAYIRRHPEYADLLAPL